MKFLSDLASCYGRSSKTATPLPQQDPAVLDPSPGRRARRVNSFTRSASTSQPWRPGLDVIMEDAATQGSAGKDEGRKVNRSGTMSNKGKSTANIRSSSHNDNYSKRSMQVILTGFSPTPFVF